MDIREAIESRHSVRQYKDEPIPEVMRSWLDEQVTMINGKTGLSIQVIYDDPNCMNTFLAHYGKFSNANNYIALVGAKSEDLEEKAGFYGQALVLMLQKEGLNTCWIGGTYGKRKCRAEVGPGEKLVCIITFGFGETQGNVRKSRPIEQLCNVPEKDMPDWFREGMRAAMLAPTAINQQKFFVTLSGDEVSITAKAGPFSKVDLGIVKYNFEAASGHICK